MKSQFDSYQFIIFQSCFERVYRDDGGARKRNTHSHTPMLMDIVDLNAQLNFYPPLQRLPFAMVAHDGCVMCVY